MGLMKIARLQTVDFMTESLLELHFLRDTLQKGGE